MKHFLNERQVEIVETDWHPNEMAWVTSAYYIDSDVNLTDSELKELSDHYQDTIYQDKYEHMASMAYDRYKDRD